MVQCKRSVTDNLAFARTLAISWRFRIHSPNEGRGEITRINGVTRFPRHGRGINHGAVVGRTGTRAQYEISRWE